VVQGGAVCCSALQCVVRGVVKLSGIGCSVVTVLYSVLCCTVLRVGAMCCSVLSSLSLYVSLSISQCVAHVVRLSMVLVAGCCRVLQVVAMWCRVVRNAVGWCCMLSTFIHD